LHLNESVTVGRMKIVWITLAVLGFVASVFLAIAVNAYYGLLGLVALALGFSVLSDFFTARGMERSIDGGTGNLHHEIVGREVVVKDEFAPHEDQYMGRVFLDGESWQAISPHLMTTGEPAVIHARDGLVLHVQRRS
ncbi:MAG: NfeD family protein, partial [Pseudomonadales bacterium]